MASVVNFIKYLKKNYHKSFSAPTLPPQKKETEALPNSFHKTCITDPVSLMSMDTKSLNKIIAKLTQQHMKRIILHEQVEFIPGIQGWF